MTPEQLQAIRDRAAAFIVKCETCSDGPTAREHATAEECGRKWKSGWCLDPESHHPYVAATAGKAYMPGDIEAWDRADLIAEVDRLRALLDQQQDDGR